MTSDDPEIALDEKLDALAKRKRLQSKAALIRHHLPKIEAAKSAGASNAEIVESFRQAGFDISLSTFQSTLSRMRKKIRNLEHGDTHASERTPNKTQQATPGGRTRRGLEMPDPPKKFHWDPLEEPKITFGGKDIKDIKDIEGK
jgi:hypothetical protein